MGSPSMAEIYGLKKALKEERKDQKKKSKQDDWVQATDIWYVGYKWDCIVIWVLIMCAEGLTRQPPAGQTCTTWRSCEDMD